MSFVHVFSLLCLLIFGSGSPTAAQSREGASPASPGDGAHTDPIQTAYLHFERTGEARMIVSRGDGGHVVYPYGHTRPRMRCPLLNACVIVLGPGEGLTDEPLSGDTERWIIDTSVMGGGEPSALVIVKPQFCGIATNLVIPTSLRIYELALESEGCESKGKVDDFTRQMRFWYPDEMRAAWLAEQEVVVEADPDPSPVVVIELNRAYDVERGGFLNRKRYPWIPIEVFDDGVRTHIVLPEAARRDELPILYLLEDGERHILNYAIRGDTIVSDRVFRRAVLVVGRAGGDETIQIENRAPVRREDGGQ